MDIKNMIRVEILKLNLNLNIDYDKLYYYNNLKDFYNSIGEDNNKIKELEEIIKYKERDIKILKNKLNECESDLLNNKECEEIRRDY
jgi:peptidoglycan hydrolase CwlO-like protein